MRRIYPGSFTLVSLTLACGIDRARDDFYAHHATRTGGSSESSSPEGSSGSSSGTDESSSTGSSTSTDAESTDLGEVSTSSSSSTSDGSSEESSSESPSVCGNGLQEGDEECDDGNADDQFDACTSKCYRPRIIFVTSTLHRGDLNTIGGADSLCRQAAGNAELPDYLNYKAILSDSKTDAKDRLFPAKGPYRLVNGLQVARDFEALMNETLEHPVDTTELGTAPPQPAAWTGTQLGGTAVPGSPHCKDWTSSSAIEYGIYGRATAVDGDWLNVANPVVNPTICIEQQPLYCLEQE